MNKQVLQKIIEEVLEEKKRYWHKFKPKFRQIKQMVRKEFPNTSMLYDEDTGRIVFRKGKATFRTEPINSDEVDDIVLKIKGTLQKDTTAQDLNEQDSALSDIIEQTIDEVLDEKKKKKSKKRKKKVKVKRDACYHKVKSRYDVWPSAYASGALVKCRKVGAKNWGKSKKNEEKIPGGLGAELEGSMEDQHKQIANKHGVSVAEIEKELKKGLKIEMEHTTDKATAHEIAMDHLMEDPKYYSKLVKANLEEKKKKAGTESSKESSLRDWFGRKGAKGSKGGWVDCNAPDGSGGYKSCGRSDGEKRKRYPSCRPTPGACKEKGKGKSWGKKGAKKKNEALDMRKGMLYEGDESTLEIFEGATLEDGSLVCEACLFETLQEASCGCPDLVMEAEYRGRKVTLNKPMRGDVKKFKVYVKDPKTGNIKKVNFGDPNMRIKKSNPKRRKSFRARHNCDNPGPKTKARYWSCKKW